MMIQAEMEVMDLKAKVQISMIYTSDQQKLRVSPKNELTLLIPLSTASSRQQVKQLIFAIESAEGNTLYPNSPRTNRGYVSLIDRGHQQRCKDLFQMEVCILYKFTNEKDNKTTEAGGMMTHD